MKDSTTFSKFIFGNTIYLDGDRKDVINDEDLIKNH